MAAERSVHVIVNPNSANGRTGREWPAMRALLDAAFPALTVRMTTHQGEATDLVRASLLEGADVILSVGGDGTHNESVNGFFDSEGAPIRPEAVLGVLSSGTGGDFRKTLKMPKDFPGCVDFLRRAKPAPIDVGRLQCVTIDGAPVSRYFVNITSFGISGLVDHYVNRTTKVFGGKVSFLVGTVRAMFHYHNQLVRLRVDDDFDEEIRINTVAVANGQYFGGGMWFAPNADLADGLFDVVVMGDVSKKQALFSGARVYNGTHIEMPEVTVIRGRRVVADSSESVLIDMDGEQPGRLPATLEIVPSGVLVLKGEG
ncbi:MAG: diacylglycerol kinase family lipid kinase [Myxococcales bacterium]|nr:diacylglycerol kinase family lipid kinase [Myxococcales bacterium]